MQTLSAVHEQAARFAAARAGRAPAVLDDAAKRSAARIAVAEVQRHHATWSMAQLRFEVHRALPVLPPGADGEAVVAEVAGLAVSGRAGTGVVQVTAPDITDVTSLGVRASDGGSIYRPPHEERYATLPHLDTEEHILTGARRTVPQLVTAGRARAAAAHAGLTGEQRGAVVAMLTAMMAATVLVAPAGAGKSRTVAGFAQLWTTFTGRRVLGLTTSTNAARVLAHEGLAESYNIAAFLGKVEGSDELRRPVPLHRDDVLVLDEASQLSTVDLAMICEAARVAGARIIATGDTRQLGAVEAGGMFRLLAQEVPAAELARRVQAKLAAIGTVGPPQAALADGNQAGVGDLVRARLNTEIDAGGRALTNRDTLQVAGFRGPDDQVRRQRPDGTWTGPFRVPRSYLARSAELAYAGNVHVAQGRTVDTAHLLVTGTLSAQALYVGMTRGRQANTAHVVTGPAAPPGHPPCPQAAPEAVLAGILHRGVEDLSATEQIRRTQEWAGGTGHLLTLWSAATRPALYPDIDRQITARLTESQAWRYQREHSRHALQQRLRAAQLAGHDIGLLIGQITAAPLDRARSISSVLHGRLQHVTRPEPGHDLTWSQRTPDDAPAVARELAAGLDGRIAELGEQMIERPQPWLLNHLGMLAPGASPALRADYARRAGIAAGYREAAGISDPGQAVSPQPHRANPELDAMRLAAMKALAIPENPYATMTKGELEARVLDGQRAQAAAPPDVSGQLRVTAHAEADAWRQSADAAAAQDESAASNARTLARQLAADKTRLEARNAAYETWSGRTGTVRETAAQAKAELGRRDQMQTAEQPPTVAGWWRQFEADLAAVERAITREHQAAIGAGRPWPPQHTAHRPQPRTPRQPQSSLGCTTLGTSGNPARTRKSSPLDPPRRTQKRPQPDVRPTTGRPAWTRCRPARTRPRTASWPTPPTGKPAHSTPPDANARPTPTPTPSRQPNARPKPRTDSKWSHRSSRRQHATASRPEEIPASFVPMNLSGSWLCTAGS
jgi:AAA domain